MTNQQAGKNTATIALVQGGLGLALVVFSLATFNLTFLVIGGVLGLAGIVSGRKAGHQGATALSGVALGLAVLVFVYAAIGF